VTSELLTLPSEAGLHDAIQLVLRLNRGELLLTLVVVAFRSVGVGCVGVLVLSG
jgi:hypothetical protein